MFSDISSTHLIQTGVNGISDEQIIKVSIYIGLVRNNILHL